MTETLQLEIATPEGLVLDAQVTEAQWPAKNGYMGVLPGHAPLVSALGIGLLTYSRAGESDGGSVNIEGGFVEVMNDQVRILADKAEATAQR